MADPARFVYLDHAATTPLGEGVLAAMLPYLEGEFANPSGAYRFARRALHAVDEARERIAALAGWDPGAVVFTSGGTEADNTIVAGRCRAVPGEVVTTAAEHHALLAAAEREAHRIVAVDAAGHVDLDALSAALSPRTTLVSVIAVNNEVGTITDLAAVAEVVRERAPGAVLHTDAVQAAAWLPLASLAEHVDALSISAHKVGGPKGVGALLVRPGTKLDALLVGGGQERDRRAGTTNVAGVVGLAEALSGRQRGLAEANPRIAALRERLVAAIVAGAGTGGDVRVTVPPARTVPGIAHLCCRGVSSEALLFLLDQRGVCASAASACASGALQPSHVLAAMGVAREWSQGALRLTLGTTTTHADVDLAAAAVLDALAQLRATPHERTDDIVRSAS